MIPENSFRLGGHKVGGVGGDEDEAGEVSGELIVLLTVGEEYCPGES